MEDMMGLKENVDDRKNTVRGVLRARKIDGMYLKWVGSSILNKANRGNASQWPQGFMKRDIFIQNILSVI